MQTIDENKIIKMYLEDKLSAVQIAQRLVVSESKICRILGKNKIQKRSISEAIIQLNITKFHKTPFLEKSDLSLIENDLKITGIMLYWGEGAKTGNSVKLANSDPAMIKIFLLFLREICGVDERRIKMLIHIYPDQDWEFLKKFWSSVSGIDFARFYKPQILKGKTGTYKKKSIYGTATITYSDTKLLKRILEWIGEYKNNFLKMPE